MEYITDKGIILMVLISDLLILASVVVTLLLARSLSDKNPAHSAYIIKLIYIISPALVIMFGLLAETIIALVILWTVGFI